MVADAQPVSFLLHLPLDECPESMSTPLLDLGSGYNVAVQSAIALHVSLCPDHRGWSIVPFPSLLDLGIRFTHVRELHLSNIVVQPNTFEDAPLQQPRFAYLESLVIANWSAYLPIEGAFSWFILHLIQHMPRLKNLTVYAPMTRQFGEPPGKALRYPELPFSLTRFICAAAIPASACAHIVLCSRDTLEAVKVNLSDDDDAPLIAALARAAPRLRSLRIIDIRRRHEGQALRSLLAALPRVETLRIEASLVIHYVLSCASTLRDLSLRCTRNWSPLDAAAVSSYVVSAPLLRNIALRGFRWDDCDEDRRTLLELCRARRIRCHVSH